MLSFKIFSTLQLINICQFIDFSIFTQCVTKRSKIKLEFVGFKVCIVYISPKFENAIINGHQGIESYYKPGNYHIEMNKTK